MGKDARYLSKLWRLLARAEHGNRNLIYWPFTQRLLFGSWTPASPLPSEATRGSHSPDEIKKYAFVVVLQIGQVVGEVGEVVTDASLQVLANVMIDRGQRAAAALTYIR